MSRSGRRQVGYACRLPTLMFISFQKPAIDLSQTSVAIGKQRWSPKTGRHVKADSHTLLRRTTTMSSTRRRRYPFGLKAKAALEAVRGEQTVSEPSC